MNADLKNIIDLTKNNSIETPCLIYSANEITKVLYLLKESQKNLGARFKPYMALKCCYNLEVLKLLKNENVGIETMTENEYEIAVNCGYSGESIIVNGMGRRKKFLETVISNNAFLIIDSMNDLLKVKDIFDENQPDINLGIRFKIGLEDFSNSPYNQTNKLGISAGSELYNSIIAFANTSPKIQVKLIHAHVTVNELDPKIYLHAINELHKIFCKLKNDLLDNTIQIIDIGGGFEVFDEEKSEKYKSLFENIAYEFGLHFPNQELAMEPGRFLTAHSGFVVTKVLDIKKVEDIHFICVDAGTNILIPIPTARYKLLYPGQNEKGEFKVILADGITSPKNTICPSTLGALPKIGDTMVIGNCGAYTDVMGSFWGYDIYNVLFVDKDMKIKHYRTKEEVSQLKQLIYKIN